MKTQISMLAKIPRDAENALPNAQAQNVKAKKNNCECLWKCHISPFNNYFYQLLDLDWQLNNLMIICQIYAKFRPMLWQLFCFRPNSCLVVKLLFSCRTICRGQLSFHMSMIVCWLFCRRLAKLWSLLTLLIFTVSNFRSFCWSLAKLEYLCSFWRQS